MVPLAMSSVSCDGHTSANSIIRPKEYWHILFQLSSHKEQNDAIDDAISTTSL